MKSIMITAVIFLAAMIQIQASPRYDLRYSEICPAIDGRIEGDPAWETCPWSKESFRVYKTGAPAAVPTRFKALYSRDAFYLAFECTEPRMKDLKAEVNTDEFWNFDIVELFVFPRKGELLHLAVSSTGLTGQEIPGAVSVRTRFRTAWKGDARRHEDRWTCEICLPFFLIGLAPGPAGLELPFTVSRFATPYKQYSTWTHQKERLASTEYYGRLVFLPPPPQLQQDISRTAHTPHWLSLIQRWESIRQDRAWADFRHKHQKLTEQIDAIYRNPAVYASQALKLAELMEVLEKFAEENRLAEQKRMTRRFFDE